MFRDHVTTFLDRAISFGGLFVMLAVCWAMSNNRRIVQWRVVLWGTALQLAFAVVVLKVPGVSDFFFVAVDGGVRRLLSFAEAGAEFVFQAVTPHSVTYAPAPGAPMVTEVFIGRISPVMKTFAFWVLPSIIFFSALMALGYHSGVMQIVVRGFSWIMQRTMRTSGGETLSTAANIFLGQTEAPLVVRPFLATMTRSELHAIMVGGFANTAGGVLAVYVGVLKDVPGIAGHLVTQSIISAPAALACAKLAFPETEKPRTAAVDPKALMVERPDANAIEAVARGASEGMSLMINVIAMLVAFVAMVAMLNYFLGLAGLSLQQILGWVFAPFAFVMGIPWSECGVAGRLLGEKLVLTELIAYLDLQKILAAGAAGAPALSVRSTVILSYALCGFANFASIGIQIGGIGALAPERRRDLAQLGLRAMLAGNLAAFMTASVVGVLI
ncbi:MAG TPA: nucleoside transporter C-terminal domain-containing protein [Myxococcota bacterium]|jgi:CNT family concentrative nucleoside transporter|nr:nucleoside transporter C-terminal domain-containing protein [Myxococcota bacterium]